MNANFLPTRNIFFTGKGGVGKTSVACATALALADRGARVLLVSTDPASNLDEVLETPLASRPTAVRGAPNLWAMNIDPEAAAKEYRQRVVEPYRAVLPPAALASMEEQLSGACTVEIAAFDEFAKLLGDGAATKAFDRVLFDAAPTGHTLRLLSLPSAWDGFLASNASGSSCLGPLAGLHDKQRLYAATVAALTDGGVTTLALVTRPDRGALAEAARASEELAALGLRQQRLVVNGVFRATNRGDAAAAAFEARAAAALAAMPPLLAGLPRIEYPLAAGNLLGADALRSFAANRLPGGGTEAATPEGDGVAAVPDEMALPGLGELVDELAAAGRGVILTMGKGGVGKTTLAAAIAVALAERGFKTRLTTTDPAAHVAAAVGDALPGPSVGRIDPRAETADYTAEVLATSGASLDAGGRALLEEDLRSPCTEEVAVFRAFARAVASGADEFVVLDTAPTGHTILLLDAALAYHREVSRQSRGMPEAVTRLLPRLRDPDFTRVLLVATPEATPVHEAALLQDDLRRAGIEPFGWIVNQSLAPVATRDPVLSSRRSHERRYIREVVERHARRVALVGWQSEAPVGRAALGRLVGAARPREEALGRL